MADWLVQYQEYISSLAVILITTAIGIIIRANRKRRANENRQLALLKDMNEKILIATINSESCVRTLIRVSNGVKYKDILLEERDLIISEYKLRLNFKD